MFFTENKTFSTNPPELIVPKESRGMMKALSQYISALLLLIISIVGMALVSSYSLHSKNAVEGLTTNYCGTEDSIVYIGYSKNYIYLYNSGATLHLHVSVEALIDNKWINTTIVEPHTIFRISASNPTTTLLTNNGCILVIKP